MLDVKGGSEAQRLGLRPGWELVSMDGKDLRSVAKNRFAEIGVTPDPEQVLYGANTLASGALHRPRSFIFRVGGKLRALELPPGYSSVKRPSGPVSSAVRTDKAGHPVVVMRMNNSLGDNASIAVFDAAVAAVPAGAHVVIDMRDTPSGGNSTVARAMLSHFVTRPMPYQHHELTYERVHFGVAREWTEYVEPRAPLLKDAPVVLAGLWTGSMGEGITIGFDAAAEATVIGSNLGDLLGAMIEDELPASCLKVSFANERLSHVNGTAREDFIPELLLPAADTAVDGSDPAIQRALALFEDRDSQPNR